MLKNRMIFAAKCASFSAPESDKPPTTETSGGIIMLTVASVMALLMILAFDGMAAGWLECDVFSGDNTKHTAKAKKSQ